MNRGFYLMSKYQNNIHSVVCVISDNWRAKRWRQKLGLLTCALTVSPIDWCQFQSKIVNLVNSEKFLKSFWMHQQKRINNMMVFQENLDLKYLLCL